MNTTKRRLPNTTAAAAVRKIDENYMIDVQNGRVYNWRLQEVGNEKYEPRVTVHFEGYKYNVRVNKVIGYKVFGPEALHKGVQIRHINGDKYDNRAANLVMVRTARARRKTA